MKMLPTLHLGQVVQSIVSITRLLSVRLSVRSFVHNLCQGAYSVAVIAGSMKPCKVAGCVTVSNLYGAILHL